MIEVKCYKDIIKLTMVRILPSRIIEMLKEELVRIKSWSDEYNEVNFTEFHTDDYDYGYIVLLDGNETCDQLKSIGLSEGLQGIIPEVAYNYYFDNEKWTKIVVVYNDSYSMVFYLRNSNQFDSYTTTEDDGDMNMEEPF